MFSKRETMMLSKDPQMQPTPKQFPSAVAPFPRSSWINPHAPTDNFDRVCKIIWKRTKEAEVLCTGSHETQQNKDDKAQDSIPCKGNEKQPKRTDDSDPYTQYGKDKRQNTPDFILPCPYLPGRRHVAKPSRIPSLVMEGQMKRYEEEAMGQRNWENFEDIQKSFEKSHEKNLVPQSSSRRDKQSSAPEPEHQGRNVVFSASEGDNSYLQEEEKKRKQPPPPSKLGSNACESEDELSVRSTPDSSLSDDDVLVTLPGARTCASDGSDDESAHEEEHSSDKLSSDSRQGSPSFSTKQDFPHLSTIKAGIQPCPTEPPASGKMHSQWGVTLSFRPNDIPTATRANDKTAHVQACIQGKAPQANSETNVTPAAQMQQETYDLLADFPALEPPMQPLVIGEVQRLPRTKNAKGKKLFSSLLNPCQENGASHQRREENVPHEVSSICAGDQKSVPDLQPFGMTGPGNFPTISCDDKKGQDQKTPTVAGTDGVGGNARSWASAAKAGMRQAAAPQEKARPCTFQQTVTINRAKARYSVKQNVRPSHQAVRPLTCHGPRPRHPNQFVRPGHPHLHQHSGAQVHRANVPSGFRWRFPFQQVRGNLAKHSQF